MTPSKLWCALGAAVAVPVIVCAVIGLFYTVGLIGPDFEPGEGFWNAVLNGFILLFMCTVFFLIVPAIIIAILYALWKWLYDHCQSWWEKRNAK